MLLSSLLHSSANLTAGSDWTSGSLAPSSVATPLLYSIARVRRALLLVVALTLLQTCVYTALTGSYGLN